MRLKLKNSLFLKTRISELDHILNHGLKMGKLSHFYGKPGVGKTTLALQLAISTLDQQFEVLWIDLNHSFSLKRFLQLSMENHQIFSKFKLKTVESYEDYNEVFYNLGKIITNTTKLVVFEPITHYYSLYSRRGTEFKQYRDLYDKKLPYMARIALEHDLHIIFVNSIRGDFKKGIAAIGQAEINKYCKYVFKLDFNEQDNNSRIIHIEKLHNKNTEFKIICKLEYHGFIGCKNC
ncbi:MAG: ATPase domain-containing protein [Candidatus Helarchaeota archaeon]